MSPGRDRGHRLAALLPERGLDALLVYSDGTCSILRPSYVQFVAGFRPLGGHTLVSVSADGHTAALVEPAWDARRVAARSWIGDVQGAGSLAIAVRPFLQSRRTGPRLGLAGGREMPAPVYEALAAGWRLEPADDLVERVARDRTPADLDLVRQASSLADIGFEAFRRTARVGLREYELVAEVEYAMRSAGADDVFILIASGPRNAAMRAPGDRMLAPGDIVIGEISPVYRGQFTQICRTVVLGRPDTVLTDKYALLVDAMEQAIDAVRVGRPASVIATTIDAVLGAAGYAEYCRDPYMRTRGHGFGVGSIAPGPSIDARNDSPLEEGHVLVVHPNQFLPETGYLACGDPVLVSSRGAERLTGVDAALFVNEI